MIYKILTIRELKEKITVSDLIEALYNIADDAVLVKETGGMKGSDFTVPVTSLKLVYQFDPEGLNCAPDFSPERIASVILE